MAQKTSIPNSELAVRILSAIASRTDGNYSTNLADELDKSQPSISRILTELHTIGFIEKGRREKAQYYTINYERISEYWFDQIREKLEEKEKTESLKELKEHTEEINELSKSFFRNVLESNNISGMTVSRLLFNGFAYAISCAVISRNEILEENNFLNPVIDSLQLYLQEKEFSSNVCTSMEKSIEETLE